MGFVCFFIEANYTPDFSFIVGHDPDIARFFDSDFSVQFVPTIIKASLKQADKMDSPEKTGIYNLK